MCKICKMQTEPLMLRGLKYHYCSNCGFLAKDDRLIVSLDKEYERYKLHHNDLDLGYQNYQNQFLEAIKPFLRGKIFDFGCGDNHVLSTLLAQNGFASFYYDKFFYKDLAVFNQKYGTIILEEVIEHLAYPLETLKKLATILTKDGVFIIRTNLFNEKTNLENWWYLRDITHLSFFQEKTFLEICKSLLLHFIYSNGKDIIILGK